MSAKGGSSASAWDRERDYHKGPVTLRRGQVPGSTTDQRLLDSHGGTDWVHTDPWRVLRIQAEFVEGFGALAEIGPAVSVFGSARTKPDHPMYVAAEEIGRRLVDRGFAGDDYTICHSCGLDLVEEPHLGRLMDKIRGPAKPAAERMAFARPADPPAGTPDQSHSP